MHTTKRLDYLCSKGVTDWWKDIENCWCAWLQSSGPKVLFVWVPRGFVDCQVTIKTKFDMFYERKANDPPQKKKTKHGIEIDGEKHLGTSY